MTVPYWKPSSLACFAFGLAFWSSCFLRGIEGHSILVSPCQPGCQELVSQQKSIGWWKRKANTAARSSVTTQQSSRHTPPHLEESVPLPGQERTDPAKARAAREPFLRTLNVGEVVIALRASHCQRLGPRTPRRNRGTRTFKESHNLPEFLGGGDANRSRQSLSSDDQAGPGTDGARQLRGGARRRHPSSEHFTGPTACSPGSASTGLRSRAKATQAVEPQERRKPAQDSLACK